MVGDHGRGEVLSLLGGVVQLSLGRAVGVLLSALVVLLDIDIGVVVVMACGAVVVVVVEVLCLCLPYLFHIAL